MWAYIVSSRESLVEQLREIQNPNYVEAHLFEILSAYQPNIKPNKPDTWTKILQSY